MATTEQYSGGYSSLIVEQFKQRTLARQGAFVVPYLTPGLTVLDCGCGPGSMTLDLADLVHPGQVYALDSSPIQIAQARLLQQQRATANVRFLTASAYALPYADHQFDVVFAHALLYHLRTPAQALAEFRRVLKPGGIVAVRDACHTGDLMMPESPELTATWETIARVVSHHGGNINFGAQHAQILLDHGFHDIRISCSYDMFVSVAEKTDICRYWQTFLATDHRQLILEQQWLTEAELARQCAALAAWCAHPASFFARARGEAVART